MHLVTDPLMSAAHTPTAQVIAGALVALALIFVPLTSPIRRDRNKRADAARTTPPDVTSNDVAP
jgi:hypothetical protein